MPLALALACAPASTLDPDDIRAALPTRDVVQLQVPGEDGGPSGLHGVAWGVSTPAAFPESSYLALLTRQTSRVVNDGIWRVLTRLEDVTGGPPTSCDASSCTWGPAPEVTASPANEWLVVARRVPEGFSYRFSARPLGTTGPSTTMIEGTALAGADGSRSRGDMVVYFDAEDALAHPPEWVKPDHGTLRAVYDAGSVTLIDVTILGGRADDPLDPFPLDASYAYEGRGAAGAVQIAFVRLDTGRATALHTRWDAARAGRSDAVRSSGALSARVTECWGPAPAYAPSFTDAPPGFGSEAACAFSPASWPTLAPPAR